MIIGIPLACQHHKRDSGCKFGEKCELRHAGWQSAQQKAEEKWWKRNCCFIEEFEASVLRVPLFRAAEIQVRHMSERGPYAPNVKRELTKKTLPQERYAAGMHGKCRTMSTSSKRRTKPHSTRLQKFGHYQRRLRRKIFCGGFRILTTINTVNGVVQTNEEATVYVNDLEWCATIEIFEDTLADLSQGKLYEDLGYSYDLASGQNTSYQRGRNIQCNTEKLCNNRCPRIIDRFFQFYCKYISCVVNAGLNRNLLTSKYHLHWEASQQILQKPKSKIKQGHCTDTVRLVARFARGARGIHRKSRRRRSVSIKGHTRNTSQNSDLERPAKVVSRKHSFFFFSHFPNDRNCDVCKRTKNYKGALQETHWWRSTSFRKFRWLDNSRSQSVQWRMWSSKQSSIRRCGAGHPTDPVKCVQNKKLQETQRSLQKFLEPNRKPKVIYTDNSLEFGKSLWRSFLESLYVNTQIGNKWDCWGSSAQSKGMHLCFAAIRSGWKMVGGFHGVPLLSAKNARSLCPMGKAPCERRFGEPHKGPVTSFGSMVEHRPITTQRTSPRIHYEEKNESGLSKNRSLTTLEDCAVFTSLIQRMRSSKKLFKMREESCKFRFQQRCLARLNVRCTRGLVALKKKCSTEYACIVEADESTRKRMEGTLHNYHEDHIAGKGINSLSHYNPVHTFIPMPQAMKIHEAKTAVDKEWNNCKRFRHGSWRKSETRKRWSMKQGKKAKQCIFRRYWTSVISRLRNWNQNIKKYRGRVVLRGTSNAVFTEQGSSASQMTAAKEMDVTARPPGCAGQAADAVSAYTQVKMEDAPKLLKIPKSEWPSIWIPLPKHRWPKSWSSMEDPVVPLERNLYGHLLARTVMWKAIWENPIGSTVGQKVSKLGMSLRSSWKRNILLCACGRHKLAGKNKTLTQCGKYIRKKSTWASQHHSWPCPFGLHSTNMRNEQRNGGQSTEKLPCSENLRISSWSYDMVGACQGMCGAILRSGEQNDPETVHNYNFMPWWPSIQRRRIGICWRIVKNMLSNGLEMRVLGTHW